MQTLPIYQRFCQYLKAFNFEDNPKIAIGVSGGADSLALVYLANAWAKENKGEIIAITIDHDLREESANEALYVKDLLTNEQIKHYIIKWEHSNIKNIQSDARNARYNLLTDFCIKNSILHLFTAHHYDDQAETILMNLHRGSGIDGLIGIRKERIHNKVHIIRPLLELKKIELYDFLNKLNIKWIEDPSNKNTNFTRVKHRNYLSGEQLFTDRLNNTATHLIRIKDLIEQQLNLFLIHNVKINDLGYATIKIDNFIKLPQEIALRALVNTLTTIGVKQYKTRFVDLTSLYDKILTLDFKKSCLHNCHIEHIKEDKLLIIYPSKTKLQPKINKLNDNQLMWNDRFLFKFNNAYPSNIYIDYLSPEAWSQIKKNFTEELFDKKYLKSRILFTLPAIMLLENIIAIPHINYWKHEEDKNNISVYFNPNQSLTNLF